MATTQQDLDAAGAEFAAGFDNPPEEKVIGDDEAFGLADEIPAGDSGTGEPALTTSTEEPAPPADPAPAAADPVAPGEGEMPAEPAGEQPALDMPGEVPAEAEPEAPAEDKAGRFTAAMERIAADFGPEFFDDFKVVIEHMVGQALANHQETAFNPLVQVVNEAIDQVEKALQAQHFSAIARAHANFAEIVDSPEFGEWMAGLPEAEKADVGRITESGSAEEVISVLDAYKKSLEQSAGADEFDEAIAGAEGVRSSGLTLPDEPPASEDYAEAWEKA